MFGVIRDFYSVNHEKQKQMNDATFKHNVVNQPTIIETRFSNRPAPTRYVKMPIIDTKNYVNKDEIKISASNKLNYLPVTEKGPWNQYMSNIDIETTLRNQNIKNSKCDNNLYIPSSKSDLYNKNHFSNNTGVNTNQHQLLFNEPTHNPVNRNKFNLQDNFFNNHTRVQRNNI